MNIIKRIIRAFGVGDYVEQARELEAYGKDKRKLRRLEIQNAILENELDAELFRDMLKDLRENRKKRKPFYVE